MADTEHLYDRAVEKTNDGIAERDARIAQLERERDEAMRDAQRFRWIAETQTDIDWVSDPDNQVVVWSVLGRGDRGRTLGDAIDAAMKANAVPSPLRKSNATT